jgi:hypothetical protein
MSSYDIILNFIQNKANEQINEKNNIDNDIIDISLDVDVISPTSDNNIIDINLDVDVMSPTSDDIDIKLSEEKSNSSDDIDIKLSEEQLNIVNCSDKYIKIQGVPGCGKTTTLIQHAINFKHLNPLILTFVSSVTEEIKDKFNNKNIIMKRVNNSNHYYNAKYNISIANIDAFIDYQLTNASIDVDRADYSGKKLKLYDNIINEKITDFFIKNPENNNITSQFLIIDEAQDLDEITVSILIDFLKKNQNIKCAIYGDIFQTLYDKSIANELGMDVFSKKTYATNFNINTTRRCPSGHVNFINNIMANYKKKYNVNDIIFNGNITGDARKPIIFTHENNNFDVNAAQSCKKFSKLIKYITNNTSYKYGDICSINSKTNENNLFKHILNRDSHNITHFATKNEQHTGKINWNDAKENFCRCLHKNHRNKNFGVNIDYCEKCKTKKKIVKTILSSIHAFKGKESQCVVINDVTHGAIPLLANIGKSEELLDISKLYVALSRSKDILLIGMNKYAPSAYLKEVIHDETYSLCYNTWINFEYWDNKLSLCNIVYDKTQNRYFMRINTNYLEELKYDITYKLGNKKGIYCKCNNRNNSNNDIVFDNIYKTYYQYSAEKIISNDFQESKQLNDDQHNNIFNHMLFIKNYELMPKNYRSIMNIMLSDEPKINFKNGVNTPSHKNIYVTDIATDCSYKYKNILINDFSQYKINDNARINTYNDNIKYKQCEGRMMEILIERECRNRNRLETSLTFILLRHYINNNVYFTSDDHLLNTSKDISYNTCVISNKKDQLLEIEMVYEEFKHLNSKIICSDKFKDENFTEMANKFLDLTIKATDIPICFFWNINLFIMHVTSHTRNFEEDLYNKYNNINIKNIKNIHKNISAVCNAIKLKNPQFQEYMAILHNESSPNILNFLKINKTYQCSIVGILDIIDDDIIYEIKFSDSTECEKSWIIQVVLYVFLYYIKFNITITKACVINVKNGMIYNFNVKNILNNINLYIDLFEEILDKYKYILPLKKQFMAAIFKTHLLNK